MVETGKKEESVVSKEDKRDHVHERISNIPGVKFTDHST